MNDKFAYWLAGLIDGEGHFAIDNRAEGRYSCSFSLTLRDDDSKTIRIIHEITGIGRVQSLDKRDKNHPQTRWVVYSKKDCNKLRDILKKYPLRAKKSRDFILWSMALDEWMKVNSYPGSGGEHHDWTYMRQLSDTLKIIRKYTPELEMPQSPEVGFFPYLSGLIDGEGSFVINRRLSKRKDHTKCPYVYYCNFSLDMREDDKNIIREIYHRVESLGAIITRNKRSETSEKQTCWRIQSKQDALSFRDIILREKMCFMTKKSIEFEIWDQALSYFEKCPPSMAARNFDWSPMEELRNELLVRRAYQDNPPSPRYIKFISTGDYEYLKSSTAL